MQVQKVREGFNGISIAFPTTTLLLRRMSYGIKFEKSMLLNPTLCFSRKFRAIPRFCDFVTGTSQELFELFLDLKKMFFETGYILQQCALANNTDHFKMVLESVSCSEEDLLYVDPETGGLCCPIVFTSMIV